MKLNQLLPPNGEPNLKPGEAAIWNYLYADAFYDSVRYRKILLKTPGTNPALTVFNNLSDDDKAEFISDNQYFTFITVKDGKVYTPNGIICQYAKQLGPPPFKFESTGLFIVTGFNDLKIIPAWFPSISTKIKITGKSGITSLAGIDKIIKDCREIVIDNSPIASSVLGLLRIKNLNRVELGIAQSLIDAHPIDGFYTKLDEILNKHLKNGRNILDCQSELLDAGFDEYAKL